MAGFSSVSSADRGDTSSAVPWSQKQVSTAPTSGRDAKVRRPFQQPPVALAFPVANIRVPRRSPPYRVPPLLQVEGLPVSAFGGTGIIFGAESWVLSILQTDTASLSRPLLLPSLTPRYYFQRLGQDLLGHWLCAGRSSGCCPRTPWKSYSVWVLASPVVFSWWKR